MKKVEKLKVINKTINNRKCKIAKYSDGCYDIAIKGEEKAKDINIVYCNNLIRLDQITDKENNEFYAVEILENKGKEFFAYSNDKKVGELKEIVELSREIGVIQEDIKLLKNIKTEIDEIEKENDIRFKMNHF